MVNIRCLFNGVEENYKFDMAKEKLESRIDNETAARGYTVLKDVEGNFIFISPSQVPIMEITEL